MTKFKVTDPGYRAAKFLQVLRRHGMRSVHENRIYPPRPTVLVPSTLKGQQR